jgi:hypothetical protein
MVNYRSRDKSHVKANKWRIIMKMFKVMLFSLLLISGANALAGGFDTDISDYSFDSLASVDHSSTRTPVLKDYVEKYLQTEAVKKGIKGEVDLSEFKYTFGSKNGSHAACKKIEVANNQIVANNVVHVIKLSMNPLSPGSIFGVIHHELGHALYLEKKLEAAQNYRTGERKETFHREEVAEEEFADAAVPDDKKMLKNERNHFRIAHIFTFFRLLNQNFSWQVKPLDNGKYSIKISIPGAPTSTFFGKIKNFTTALKVRRDFSEPMNEMKAQIMDTSNEFHDDHHPSAYRRAYYFDGRLKALEVKERESSIEKGNLLSNHVEQLTTSDVLS